jgi:murein DD-endopeptidase MepM/ murein hydrolase activator NlpD
MHISTTQLWLWCLVFMTIIFSGYLFFASAKHGVSRRAFPLENNTVANSESAYESKLLELQARLLEAQHNLNELDAARNQLPHDLNSRGPHQLGPQGGPLKPARYELLNEGEIYGVRLDRTLQESTVLAYKIKILKSSLTQNQEFLKSIPSTLPLPFKALPSSGPGYRTDPFTRQLAWHDGIDFPAEKGTPVLSTAEGIVKRANWDDEYGYVVELEHRHNITTRYAHAQAILVKQGERVKRGQILARVGSTGRSTGPHLHYEILQNGRPLVVAYQRLITPTPRPIKAHEEGWPL